jgi:hypothetical protein
MPGIGETDAVFPDVSHILGLIPDEVHIVIIMM